MPVIRSEQAPGIERAPGVHSVPLVTKEAGARSLSTGVTTFAPGAALYLHTHEVEESITVIEGEAVCEIGGGRYILKPYDTAFVPPGVPHRFLNESGQIMRFVWAYPAVEVERKPV